MLPVPLKRPLSHRDRASTAWYAHQTQAAEAMRLEAIAAGQLAVLTATHTDAPTPWRWVRDLAVRPVVVALFRYRVWLLKQAVAHQEAALRVALYAEAQR